MTQKPTFREAFMFWLKLGFISFGGPAGQIAIMHTYLVDKKKWISDSKFLHALNYCMILPGPEAQQLATYTGWLLHGTWGGLAAGLLFVLPSMFILLGLSILYVTYGSVPVVNSMFLALKPAVIAIVALALLKIGKKSLLVPFHYVVAAAAFVCIFFFHIPFPLIVLGALVLGWLVKQFAPDLMKTNAAKTEKEAKNEQDYYLNSNTKIEGIGFKPARLAKQVAIALVFWGTPFLFFHLYMSDAGFWFTLSKFFTQAAFVTFGGAYAVLPYVAQVSVEQHHWLSELQMIDGLALGETTPGPLVMVLSFVGFMAGYNYFGSALGMGAMGLVTTTYYTFLPCFLFIFAGAPIIESTQGNKQIKALLSLVTAAVVGVVLNLTIFFGKAVLFPQGSWLSFDYISAAWVVFSIIALHRLKINMILWIGISAIAGLLVFLIKQGF